MLIKSIMHYMGKEQWSRGHQIFNKLAKSLWLFPVIGLAAILLLTSLKISGSSIGTYYSYFYGKADDPDLILNIPRSIRSDEWLTNTQMSLAQKHAGYPKINPNLGNGEDVAIILDAPYKDWSMVFKPHNLVFFVLPFEYAFALKWWLIGYLLILSVYLFILSLLPKKRLLASIIALGVFFSPFIQWWYQFVTLAPIYYGLFFALTCMYLMRSNKRKLSLMWGGLAAYLLISFALVQYPPFQIASAVAVTSFLIGYIIEQLTNLSRREVLFKSAVLLCAGIIAGAVVMAFIKSNQFAFNATRNTVYPGQRDVPSGGFDGSRLLSSNLAFQFQFTGKAVNYYFPAKGVANQSEASNFIFLMPFLLLPEFYLLTMAYRNQRKIDWPLLTTAVMFLLLMVRLLTTSFNTAFKFLGLNQVPPNRLLIGLGVLGIINTILLVRHLAKSQKTLFSVWLVALYCLLVLVVEVLVGLHINNLSPGFISIPLIFMLSIPIPVILFLVFTKRFVLGALVLLAFSVFSTVGIHPVYRGMDVLTKTPLAKAIQSITKTDKGRWVTEDIMLENFALANGARSFSGVYTYPQKEIWRPLDPTGIQASIYNRFAHVNFKLDRQPNIKNPTSFTLRGGDNILVTTEPCSSYLKTQGVRFLLTESKLKGQDTCAKLIRTVKYPANNFFIYQLD